MTFTDLLIVYLAFGAPLAVYKYLQNRTANVRRKTLVSIFTFFFWVPTAVQIGYLYLSNAYFRDAFVSRRILDAREKRIGSLREAMTAELTRLARGASLHDTRETVERYAGLADAVRETGPEPSGRNALFEAAGREEYRVGQVCLMRRNLRRLKRHHTQARQDFVALLSEVSLRFDESGVVMMGIELARQLEDHATADQLTTLKVKRGELWDSRPMQEQLPAITPAQPIAMAASANND
jgi:hypothetical protein